MAERKSNQLLPEVFRTSKNTKFLNATIDQLISEQNDQRIDGFIGRRFSLNYSPTDNYIMEPLQERQNYQLEPSVIYRDIDGNVQSASTVFDMLNRIRFHNGDAVNQDALFSQEFYNWSGFVDIDKLVNYNEYFWLPDGPDPVQVFGGEVDTRQDFEVIRDANSYKFDDITSSENPTIYLARSGTYTFQINQPGIDFWIQTEPGIEGASEFQDNISTREIFGVTNNGIDQGTITFNVPSANDQRFFTELPVSGSADLATDLTYSQIHNTLFDKFIEEYGGIDGLREFNGRTLVFLNPTDDVREWQRGGLYDAQPFDAAEEEGKPGSYDRTVVIDLSERYDIYQINVSESNIITLNRIEEIPIDTRINILQGIRYGNRQAYKRFDNKLELIPPITASIEILYYQDSQDPERFGRIIIVDQDSDSIINVERDIIGQKTYTSPNGVAFTNGLKINFDTSVVSERYQNNIYYVEGVGKSITLVHEDSLVVPEEYAGDEKDYIMANRACIDNNAWARQNRWFHKEVIIAAAGYNGHVPQIDNNQKALRPIIEFLPNITLYNMGRTSKDAVTHIDTRERDAFSDINGQIGYFLDGIFLEQDMTIIFSVDDNADVRNKIYRVDIVRTENSDSVIDLVEIDTVEDNTAVLSKFGNTNKGLVYHRRDGNWVEAQLKTGINQDPLFDVFDGNDVSFSNNDIYQGSDFKGTRLFGYSRNDASPIDPVLGFGIDYRNFNNVGDIVFSNDFINDRFNYVSGSGLTSIIVKSGHVHQYDQFNNEKTSLNGWTRIVEESRQYQVIFHIVDDEFYRFDIGMKPDDTQIQSLQVFVNNHYQSLSDYDLENNHIVFKRALNIQDVVSIRIYNRRANPLGFYEIPRNLENNANNDDFETITLGQMRNHLTEISFGIRQFIGSSLGSNNLRDLNYDPYPGRIMNHSGGAILANYLLTHDSANFIDSLIFSMEEYTRFKNSFIDNMNRLDLDYRDIPKCVDDILAFMAESRTPSFPFYDSDMMPHGNEKTITRHMTNADTRRFEISDNFNLSVPSNQGVLIYLLSGDQKILLIEGIDYIFDSAVVITENVVFAEGDIIEIHEYVNTDGSYIPPTPTKMGLWSRFSPRIFTDNSYIDPQIIIQGHDGSKWIGYGDVRDQVILEYEKRVYNNIKTPYRNDIFDFSEILSGYWRNPENTLESERRIVQNLYGRWVQKNNINQTENSGFLAENRFTWNYGSAVSKIRRESLPGYWRGIYNWFYDTDTPNETPWEMLGLSEKPAWWDERYGVSPYTSGNLILWDDLKKGRLYADAQGDDYQILPNYTRDGLDDFIPVDEQGNLKSPSDFLIAEALVSGFSDPWTFGDQGPQETAWRRSSEWPFAVQLLAVMKSPAKYMNLLFDSNLFEYNEIFDQILQKNKTYRPNLADFRLHRDNYRREGYNQFIVNYIKHNNMSVEDMETRIRNLQVNLCYGISGFSDKEFLKVIAEYSTPGSSNDTIFIPDEDYEIMLKKNGPLERVSYSGINIARTETGFRISGYDIENPYFRIIPSRRTGNFNRISIGGSEFYVYNDFQNYIVDIPYGTVLRTPQQVVDFMTAYQRYLESKGIVFGESLNDSGEVKDFVLSASEFIFWNQQEWATDSVFSASPVYDRLTVEREFTTTDDFTKNNFLRDPNGRILQPSHYDISRIDNRTVITIDTDNALLYAASLNPIQYEHILVFNNRTTFNDIIYQPELGNRQERLRIVGFKAGNWNGTVHAPGYFINENRFGIWQPGRDYRKADYVSFQNGIYAAKENHEGKNIFDYNDWIFIENIRLGLQPNVANKAGRFNDFFDIDQLNLERSTDRAGKGIIGFRNRDYLENLGLDDVSQVKFYQGILKEKGTPEAVNKLINADLTNLDQEIEYYEEWGFRVGEYGSTDSNQVLEFIVDEQQSQNNPILATFLDDEDSPAAQGLSIFENDLYKRPYNYTHDIFSVGPVSAETGPISAGYPRIDDVDFTLLNRDFASLNDRSDRIGHGTVIWVANEWDVYRVSDTNTKIIMIENSLNEYLNFSTDKNHEFSAQDIVFIDSNEIYGGFHTISSINSPNSFSVLSDIVTDNIEDTDIPVYDLRSSRFSQLKDIGTPLNGWEEGELVWIDENSWKAYRKSEPWDGERIDIYEPDSQLGSDASIGRGAKIALVGASNHGNGTIISYNPDDSDILVRNNVISFNDLSGTIDGFGRSVSCGDGWHVVGSNGAAVVYIRLETGDLLLSQVLFPDIQESDSEFGYDVAITGNDRYLFVSDPANDKVYSYVLNDNEAFNDFVTGNGSDTQFELNFSSETAENILVQDEQGRIYLPYRDFALQGNVITFSDAPDDMLGVSIRQNRYYELIGEYEGSAGDRFGESIDVDFDGRTLAIGKPGSDSISIYGMMVEAFSIESGTTSVETSLNVGENIFVTINDNLINDYTQTGNEIVFDNELSEGDIVRIYMGEYAEIQSINQDGIGNEVAVDAHGALVAAGIPTDDDNAGSVCVFVDAGLRFGILNNDLSDDGFVFINDYAVNSPEVIISSVDINDDIIVTNSRISNNKLRIRPGQGEFAFEPFILMQKLVHPNRTENENYGKKVTFDKHILNGISTQNIVVSSDRASTFIATEFDDNMTIFDNGITDFVSLRKNSGAAYAYDLISAINGESPDNMPQYVLIQQLSNVDIDSFDGFGSAISYCDSRIVVGSNMDEDRGSVYEFRNPDREAGWSVYRKESDKVNLNLINRVVDYDRNNDMIVNFLDYIDPFKGKIAGQAQAELDYLTVYDPASYDTWNDEYIGRVWWDLRTCRVLEYEQGDINYRLNYWGRFFPGSSIDVYEWTESEYTPEQYIEQGMEGMPHEDMEYASALVYDVSSRSSVNRYYFWVKGKRSVPDVNFRNISVFDVAGMIEDPKTWGLKYIQIMATDAVSMVNIKSDLNNRNTVLSINYDVIPTDGILHSEFELVSQGDSLQKIPIRIYDKIVDSISGEDRIGNNVPDIELGEAERYGIHFRPRQTMFVNRKKALEIFAIYCNNVFRTVPIARQYDLSSLLNAEPEPVESEWDIRVNTIEEREYLDIDSLSPGYKVLVSDDASFAGYWTIYELRSDMTWLLTNIQTWDTTRYWNYVTWYDEGYDSTTIPQYQADTEPDLLALDAEPGQIAKVLHNDDGNISFFIMQENGIWKEIIIEQGTIELHRSLYDVRNEGLDSDIYDFGFFDSVPSIEIRNIAYAIRDDIFVESLALNFNNLFFRMVEYALTESNNNIDWMFKTSFIKVMHKLRNLEQYPTFRGDNSEFIEDYLNEVKPYKTKIREYITAYDGNEIYSGNITDFDTHSFYDDNFEIFRKPSVDEISESEDSGLDANWHDAYRYHIEEIEIFDAGSGYFTDPRIVIDPPQSDDGIQAQAVAISDNNRIVRVTLTNPGSGYTETPNIAVIGSGRDAVLIARLKNDETRKLNIQMNFDRITYSSTIRDWMPNADYAQNDLFSYRNPITNIQEVYQVINPNGFVSGPNFVKTSDIEILDDRVIMNNADRIAAYYTPGSGMPGDRLSLVQPGTEYTGSALSGGSLTQGGFDAIGFDIAPYDSGTPGDIDTIIESSFMDGMDPETEGGGFVDKYSSYAPNELIPGMTYDTLDMEVYTQSNIGNGINISYSMFFGDGMTNEFSYTEEADTFIIWFNEEFIHDFTVNYNTKTIMLNSAPSADAIVHVYGFVATGENLIYHDVIPAHGGTDYPVGLNLGQSLIFVDGTRNDDATLIDYPGGTIIRFTNPPVVGSYMSIYGYAESDFPERQAYTETHIQNIILTQGVTEYDIEITPSYIEPLESNMIINLNGNRLVPSNALYYESDAETVIYATPETNSFITDADIRVAIIDDDNMINLQPGIDYTVQPVTAGTNFRNIVLRNVYQAGTNIIVGIITDSEYSVDGNRLSLHVDFNEGDNLQVITFSNHDPLQIRTRVFSGDQEFTLGREYSNVNNVWITVDGIKLHPGTYSLNGNVIEINQSLTADNVVVISGFNDDIMEKPIGFRIFNDMLGNWNYYRISEMATTELSRDLNSTDSRIYVNDASRLAVASPSDDNPGVIFVGGERITYWEINMEENYLENIRRSTFGTRWANNHPVGTKVLDGGAEQELPDGDTHTQIWYGNQGSLHQSDTQNARFLQSGVTDINYHSFF